MANAVFDDLDGYEKGVVARALLKGLIRQGKASGAQDAEGTETLIVQARRWQLKLMALYVDDNEPSPRQRLIENLCKLR